MTIFASGGVLSRSSKLEERALLTIRASGLLAPEREYRFHPSRKWRFDFAYPFVKIAIEIEGGIWIRGSHSRGVRFNSDSEKYNEATILGWRVLRYTVDTINKIPEDLIKLCPELKKTV